MYVFKLKFRFTILNFYTRLVRTVFSMGYLYPAFKYHSKDISHAILFVAKGRNQNGNHAIQSITSQIGWVIINIKMQTQVSLNSDEV